MSFAAVGYIHTALRVLVLIGLTVVLVSRPPRSSHVMLYTQVAIILAIEAIEIKTAPVRFALTAAKYN